MSFATGTNCWTGTEDRIAALLSDLASFQTWGGAADATEALAIISFDELPEPNDRESETKAERTATPNRVMVTSTEDTAFRLDRDRTPERWSPSGNVLVLFEAAFDDEDYDQKRDELQRDEKNAIGSIMIDLWESARHNGQLTPSSIAVLYGPAFNTRPEQGTRGEVITTEILIEWARE